MVQMIFAANGKPAAGQALGKRLTMILALQVIVFLVGSTTAVAASNSVKAGQLVEKAKITVDRFQADEDFIRYYSGHLQTAKALMVVPSLIKGGLIFGGSGGSGVLLARDPESGEWNGPSFHTMGGVSFGLQAGGQAAEVLMIVRTERGLNRLLNSGVKLGGDVSVAAGPVGEGIGAGNITADIIVFSKTKGLYGGVSVEGSVVDVRNTWAKPYYGEPLKPSDILLRGKGHNPQADPLIAAVTELGKGEQK